MNQTEIITDRLLTYVFDRLLIITTTTVVRITPRSSPPNNAPSVVPTFASSMFHVQEDYRSEQSR